MSIPSLRRVVVGLVAAVVVASGFIVTTTAAAAIASDAPPRPPTEVGTTISHVQLLVACNGSTPTAATFSFRLGDYFIYPFDLSVSGTVTGSGGGSSRPVTLPAFARRGDGTDYQIVNYSETLPLTEADLGGTVDLGARAPDGYEFAGARTPVACGLTSWSPFDGIDMSGLPGIGCDGRTRLDLINRRTSPIAVTFTVADSPEPMVVTVPAGQTQQLDLGAGFSHEFSIEGHSEITRPDGTEDRIDLNQVYVSPWCEQLNAGQTLTSGRSMVESYTPNPRKLSMQSDGDLVFTDWLPEAPNFSPGWSSGTGGHPGAYLAMQTDGNLVVYSATGQPLWANGRAGTPSPSLHVTSDGGLVEDSGTTPVWSLTGPTLPPSPASGGAALAAPGYLARGDDLFAGPFSLDMQSDGNLVEYAGGRAVWSTHMLGRGVLYLQGDGNLVERLYGVERWSSGTWGHPGSVLRVQTDGNVVIYDANGRPLWATGVVR